MTRRFGLFPKYTLLIIALVGSLLVASGAVGLYFSYHENQDSLVALQFEKAQAAATRIEQYVLDIEQQVSWTALPGMDGGADPAEQRRIDYLKLLRQAPAITEAAWIDAKGVEQLRVSRLAMDAVGRGTDYSAAPMFTVPMAGKVFHSPVSFRKETEPYLTVSRRAGPGGGVTAVDVNLKFVWDVVSRIKIGDAGLAYVVDDKGTLIAHPDISLVLQKSDLSKLPQVAVAIGAKAQRAAGDAAMVEKARNARGGRVLAAHASIPTLGWTVFVESPRSEAFAPLYETLARMALVLALGLGLSVVASFFLARTLVRPIRAIQDGAERVAQGDLDHHIEVKSHDELQVLAGQFNRMSSELKASYTGLERKVDARTAELQEALDYQTASGDVLKVISQSPGSVLPVFEVILDSAKRLFGASMAAVFRYEAGNVAIVATRNWSAQAIEDAKRHYPGPVNPGMVTGRAILTRQVVNQPDVRNDPHYDKATAAAGGWRRLLAAPLLREGEPIGVITVAWHEPGDTPPRQQALVRTFADQAVIALENARLFNDLQDKTRQLEAANRHKSEFLANMSHELRTPLNAIIGFSEALIEKMFGDVNDKQMEYLQDIHSSGHHLLSLINDVLDLSKIEAGRMELDLSCFDLGQLLEHSTMLVRERAQRHGLALTLEVSDDLAEWVGDARKIKQAVVNLLSNAVKFTPNGGRVTLRARLLNEWQGQGGAFALVSVQDTGVGIAPGDQELVFEEFRQAGGDVLRKSEGTGLGLALVKRFVELHGGSVTLQSAPGAGSTFSFVLPQHELKALQ